MFPFLNSYAFLRSVYFFISFIHVIVFVEKEKRTHFYLSGNPEWPDFSFDLSLLIDFYFNLSFPFQWSRLYFSYLLPSPCSYIFNSCVVNFAELLSICVSQVGYRCFHIGSNVEMQIRSIFSFLIFACLALLTCCSFLNLIFLFSLYSYFFPLFSCIYFIFYTQFRRILCSRVAT